MTYSTGDPEPDEIFVRDACGMAWYPLHDGSGRWGNLNEARLNWPDLAHAYGPLRSGKVEA